jgi:hypothetical protein
MSLLLWILKRWLREPQPLKVELSKATDTHEEEYVNDLVTCHN